MTAAPWHNHPQTLFVLVTGTNNGIGFGICQRLIDEFLATRSLDAHLVLVATTRTVQKSRDTIAALRRHARTVAESCSTLRARAGPDYDPRSTLRRVHILGLLLDLCDFPSLFHATDKLIHGCVHEDYDDDAAEASVSIPRLDVVIFNAAIGGWRGIDSLGALYCLLTMGIVYFTTYPTFKISDVGRTVDPLASVHGATPGPDAPRLGAVFCANVFGHYMLGHALLPLLQRPVDTASQPDARPPGRIIWESSLGLPSHCLSLDDVQGVHSHVAYESSKRLTDVLALTYQLPASRPYSSAYFEAHHGTTAPPRIYLVQPGVAMTSLLSDAWWMHMGAMVIFVLARCCGSPWHPITAYKAACAPVWMALQDQAALDAAHAERSKWGSSTDVWGQTRVKKTEVEGWGWEGAVVAPDALRAEAKPLGRASRSVGRMPGTPDTTAEHLHAFEQLGADAWKEMERLRQEWEERTKAAMKLS